MSDVLTPGARGSDVSRRPARQDRRARIPTAGPRAPRRAAPASALLVGIWAALAAAAAGLLLVEAVVLSSWIAETRTAAPLSVVLRTGAAFWLLGNGAPAARPGGHRRADPARPVICCSSPSLMRSGASVARVRPAGPRRRNVLICGLAVADPVHAGGGRSWRPAPAGGGLPPSLIPAVIGALRAVVRGGLRSGRRGSCRWRSPRPSPARAIASGVGVAMRRGGCRLRAARGV